MNVTLYSRKEEFILRREKSLHICLKHYKHVHRLFKFIKRKLFLETLYLKKEKWNGYGEIT